MSQKDKLLPSEIENLSSLSRPTVFNVLKFYTETGAFVKWGKRYSIGPKFFVTRKHRKVLDGYWRLAHETLISDWAKKHKKPVEDVPPIIKEFLEARILQERHFVQFYGYDKSIKRLPGRKNQTFTPNNPIRKKSWNEEERLLRQLKQKNH